MLSKRIRHLKKVSRESDGLTRYRLWAFEGYRLAPVDLPHIRRIAEGFQFLARRVPLEIAPEDLLAGSTLGGPLTLEEKRIVRGHKKIFETQLPNDQGGITAHMAIDNEMLLSEGIAGVFERIDSRLARLDPHDPDQALSLDFLCASRRSLEAAAVLAARYAEHAECLGGGCPGARRRSELLEIAANCRQAPFGPAHTFHQAIQSVWFMFLLTSVEAGLMSLGRPDQYLWPYYQADIRAGRLTAGRAKEILQCLFIKLNEITTAPQSIIVAGRDRSGRSVDNGLTRLILDAVEELRMVNPALGLAVNRETSEDLLIRAGRMIAGGLSHPAFFNDETIIRGLERAGLAPKHARRYINCTCAEMTPEGCSGIWVVADYMNFAKCLERVLHNGADPVSGSADGPRTGNVEEFETFEQIVEALKVHLRHVLRENCLRQNRYARARMAQGGWPLLSAFVHDCIETGKDIDRGGAKYRFFYPQLVGLATVTDSLLALKKLVFEDRELSLAGFREILAKNFEGHEPLRRRITQMPPKYGNGEPEADRLALELFNFYVEEVEKYRNPYGASYHAGFLSWVMHGELGARTGAMPDGRLAGTALSDSFAASQGRARSGATGILRSVEKFDMRRAIGAAVVNLTFDSKTLATPRGPKAVADLIRSHFSRGGFEVQITVTRAADLLRAREKPDKYSDLMVRVGGFSDYFARLSRCLQDEVIQRTS